MQDIFTRVVENLAARVHGPMKFRIISQPLMAMAFAIRDGRKDALAGRAPYFWAMFTNPEHRKYLMLNGWESMGKIFIIAVVLDAVYQVWQLHWFYPGEALLVACILAIIPYLLLRGPLNRIIRDGKQEEFRENSRNSVPTRSGRTGK